MLYKCIKIVGAKQWLSSTYCISLCEIELLNASMVKVSTGGSVFAESQYDSSTYAYTNAFDGNTSTSWASAVSSTAGVQTWIAYYKAAGMDVEYLRMFTRPGSYIVTRFVDATVYGSNDSTNGSNGTWDLLVSGITMGTEGWTTFSLRPVTEVPKFNIVPLVVGRLPYTYVGKTL